MKHIVITGSASGLGKAIYEEMANRMNIYQEYDMFKSSYVPVPLTPFGVDHNEAETTDYIGDVRDAKDCSALEEHLRVLGHKIGGLINCAGVNRIGPMEGVTSIEWDKVMDTNAKAIWQMSKAFLPTLEETKGFILNIVSNASRVPMTHSTVYNASKAAAAMMTKQMARELTKSRGITVFGVNPNKLEGTGMSKYIEDTVCELRGWTPEEAAKYQLAALPAGFETKCEQVAELIVWLISKRSRHEYLTGCLLDLGGPAT